MSIITNKYHNKVKGLSLVELLIAMTIGLFLLSGIATSYVTSKSSSIKRNNVSSLEDNGRFALELMTRIIQHTGYKPASGGLNDTYFITDDSAIVSDSCPGSSSDANVSNTGIFKEVHNGASLDSDSIGVIFHGDADIFTDCSGATLPATCRLGGANSYLEPSRIYNSFFVDSTTKTLRCSGSNSGASQTIAEGVESMQILYGLDVNEDNNIDHYVNADNISNAQWNNVISVQIALLVRSLKFVKASNESRQYALLDKIITSPSDRYQRSVFSTTIYLRNTLSK